MAIRTVSHPHATRQYVEDEGTVAVHEHNANVAERTIWFLGDLLMLVLAFRFVLALLGANPTNWFANFIYTISHPFVAPFFSLFSYNYLVGVSHFEVYTLVAIAVYGIVTWILARLATLDRW